jgi:hypothetical protein
MTLSNVHISAKKGMAIGDATVTAHDLAVLLERASVRWQ